MIKREQILNKIRSFYNNELIKVLIGLRRTGKSVLLHQIIEEVLENGVEEEQIIYMNFEDFQFSTITNAAKLYEYISERKKQIRNITCFLMKYRWFRSLKKSLILSVQHGM